MRSKAVIALLVIPALIVVAFNAILPTLVVFNYSFQTPFALTVTWVGLDNYIKVLREGDFQAALARTLLFAAICLAIEIPLGIALAELSPKRGVLGGIIMTMLSLIIVIPWITVGLIWRLIVIDRGPLQDVLGRLGISSYTITNPTWAFWSLIMVDVWHWAPLVYLICLAGIQTLPEPLIVSAAIDGATPWRKFRYITLPHIKPQITFVTLLRFIDTLKVYDEPWVITGGGPGKTTEFLSIYIVRRSIGGGYAMGPASAASLVYLLMIIVLTWILMLVLTGGKGLLER
jgi:glycerol transport system permease protein